MKHFQTICWLYPNLWNSRFQAFRNSGFPDFRLFQKNRISGISRNPEVRISGFPEVRNSGKSGIPETRISGSPDFRKSGYPNIRITDTASMSQAIIFHYRYSFLSSRNYFCNVFCCQWYSGPVSTMCVCVCVCVCV